MHSVMRWPGARVPSLRTVRPVRVELHRECARGYFKWALRVAPGQPDVDKSWLHPIRDIAHAANVCRRKGLVLVGLIDEVTQGARVGGMATHELKTWPAAFKEMRARVKTYDIRKGDRDFQVGDVIRQREWLPDAERYTARETFFTVTHVTYGPSWGLPPELVVMGLQYLAECDRPPSGEYGAVKG